MANILEFESGVDPTEQKSISKENKEKNFEEMINTLMRKAYILGLSNGARAAHINFLAEIKKSKNMNPAKRVAHLKKICEDKIINQPDENVESNENENKEGINNGT